MGPKSIIVQRTLYDIRDQKTYAIAKLPDGNCWMTQNLALGSTEGSMTLTSSDSNVSSSFVLPQAQATSDTSTSWGDAANTSNTPHLYATGNDNYGNYYNWYAATAGTGLGTMSSASATNLTNATDSICPKGWRLPDGGESTSKSFRELDIAMGGTGANRTDAAQRDKLLASPYSFPYSGGYAYADGSQQQGFAGLWWTRSATKSSGVAYDLRIQSANTVHPQHGNAVGWGFSVRCVAMSGSADDISTMQQMTSDYCNNMSINDTMTLTDVRDKKRYTIAKLADSNCWMTQNLALGSASEDTLLTPSDSNVSSNFTIPSSAIETGTASWDADTLHVYIQTASDSTINVPYGNLYNWYTATAGTGTSSMANTNATADICPKGWRLPDGGPSTDKSFKSLDIAMGGTGENRYPDTASLDKFRVSPYLFPYSGCYNYDGGLSYQGSVGRWWSRSAYTPAGRAYGFALNSNGYVYPQNDSNARYGFSVRCVLQ